MTTTEERLLPEMVADFDLQLKMLGEDYRDPTIGDLFDIISAEEFKATVITPGGRVGNDAPFSRSHTSNWVARAGGLPHYFRIVAHGLMRHGKRLTESAAIHMAIGIVRNWAEGKGKVSAKVRAAAQKAIAQWEAMRARAHATPGKDDMTTIADKAWKAVEVKGLNVDDASQGIVTAIVSVTGVVDNVNDNILPGAYQKTLAKRTPKGVLGHDWNKAVAKTLEARELLPGDPGLPKQLRSGNAWPTDAGALMVKMQFNMKTNEGRDAFENVRFYGDDAEWSIGYRVPAEGGSRFDSKSGVREINTIELFEYSPVLFGAMPDAVTMDVKTAQEAWKELKSTGDSVTIGGYEYKRVVEPQVDTEPYADPKQNYDGQQDGQGDDANGPEGDEGDSVTIAVEDLELIDDLIGRLQDVFDMLTGNADGGDGSGDQQPSDAGDAGPDMTQKDYQTYIAEWDDYFVKSGVYDAYGIDYDEKDGDGENMGDTSPVATLGTVVDELEEYEAELPNFSDLAALADEFDQQMSDGDTNDALNTANNFADALRAAADSTTEASATDAVVDAARMFAELVAGGPEGNADGSEPPSQGDGTDQAESDGSGDSADAGKSFVIPADELAEIKSLRG